MLQRIRFLALVLVLCWAIGGCVTIGKYDLKEKEASEISQNLQDLRKKNADLTKENAEIKSQAEKSDGNVTALIKEKEALSSDNTKLNTILQSKPDELTKNIAELRQKSADLENENAGLKRDIANQQKCRVDEAQKTSNIFEELLEKMKNEISQGQVTISELKGKLTVSMRDAVLFDSRKAEVKPEGLAVLQKVADVLKTVKNKAIRIEGHTDNVQISDNLESKFPTNWELSAVRAVNVTRYLQQQGIDPTSLSAVACGEYRPVSGNDTTEGKAKNRRIEIILGPKETF
jgi:chemotaxis protein MotB